MYENASTNPKKTLLIQVMENIKFVLEQAMNKVDVTGWREIAGNRLLEIRP